MGVKLQSALGGSVELNAPSTASNFTMTVPAGNGTVATTDQLSTFRNKFINGNFDIWQRGTSQSATSIGGIFVADRWKGSTGGGSGQATFSRQAVTASDTAIAPSKYFYRHQQTVANTTNARFGQNIESARTLAGKNVTISFYAKANTAIAGSTTQLFLQLRQEFGTGGSPSAGVFANTPGNSPSETLIPHVFGSLTTSWQKYSITLSLPSVHNKTFGTDENDSLYFEISMPNSLGSPTTYTIDFAQVQFEEGTVATQFEFRTIGIELEMCERYYETGDAVCYMGSANSYFSIPFRVNKRANPTVTRTGSGAITGGTNGTTVLVLGQQQFYMTNPSSSVTGGSWSASAEL
jgi:hypothetical protein